MKRERQRLSHSFNKAHRLRKPSQYQRVFKSPVRISDSTLLLLAQRNDVNIARLGLAISKKNINSAVSRNLVKRLLRECFRQQKQQLEGWDIVVIAHRKQVNINRASIINTINQHFRKLQKCKNA